MKKPFWTDWIKKKKNKYQLKIPAGWMLAAAVLSFLAYSWLHLPANTVLPQNPAVIQKERQEARKCLDSGPADAQILCLNNLLREVAKTSGARSALNILEPISQEFPYLLRASHPLVHTIGTNAFFFHRDVRGVSLEGSIGRALTECDGFGAFGCYHGAIEAGLSLIPAKERAQVIRKACLEDELIQKNQYFVNQCLHWFGHGLAIFTDLPLKETLELCNGLNREFESDEVQLCLSGVFHAGAVPGGSDDEFLHNISRVWKAGDPYYPCRDVEEKFRGHCYSHTSSRTRSGDPRVTLGSCDNIPEPDPRKKFDYARRCYESAANPIMSAILGQASLSEKEKVGKIAEDCRLYSRPEYRRFCYAGAARYWVLFDPLLTNLGPFKICQRAEEESKPSCYGNIGFGNFENYYSQEKLEEYCKNSEPAYIDDCLRRSILAVLP